MLKGRFPYFAIGFGIGFLGFMLFTFNPIPYESQVLADTIEITPAPTNMPTSSPSTTVTPTPIDTSSPLPTVLPTSTPTITPSPSPSPSPTLVSPTSTPDVWSPADIEPLFTRFANEYGVDKNVLERIANCESHYNTNAQNGDYLGMFQFSSSSWINIRQQMQQDTNPTLRVNPEEAIKTAAFYVRQNGTAAWPACL